MFRSLNSKILKPLKCASKRVAYFSSNSIQYEAIGDGAFNRKSIYGNSLEMTYGGALSFLRRKYSKELSGHGEGGKEFADVVVSGIPYDGAVTYRSGARLGPRAVSIDIL